MKPGHPSLPPASSIFSSRAMQPERNWREKFLCQSGEGIGLRRRKFPFALRSYVRGGSCGWVGEASIDAVIGALHSPFFSLARYECDVTYRVESVPGKWSVVRVVKATVPKRFRETAN